MGEIKILPGRPDDDNRDYLPESLKGSDIVVNESGNNSIPYPARLKEFHGKMGNDFENVWYEYVPESYDKSKKVPLVVSCHGGLMTGWGQCVYTSWSLVAERDGFIVVFPDSSKDRQWCMHETALESKIKDTMPPGLKMNLSGIEDNFDANFVMALIDAMKEKYNIDEERIFIQGMSSGSMFTSFMQQHYGDKFTASCNSGGSQPNLRKFYTEDWKLQPNKGHLGVWQTVPETNGCPPWVEFDDNTAYKLSREFWLRINECDEDPEIKIDGEDNYAFYKGKKADYVYMDKKNRDHGNALDEAALVWDYFFSGLKRTANGTVVDTGSRLPRKGDDFNIAIADGADTAYLNNKKVKMAAPARMWKKYKYHGLQGAEKVKGEYMYAPISFIGEAFGIKCEYSPDKLSATFTMKDGKTMQVARGVIACVYDGTVRQMYAECIERDGELLIPLDWFSRVIMKKCASRFEDVLYVSDNYGELGDTMAALIRDLLHGTEHKLPDSWPAL